MSIKVTHLRLNQFKYDARIADQVESLQNNGYRVQVIALLDHNGLLPTYEIINGAEVYRLDLRSRKWGQSLFFKLVKYVEIFYKASRLIRQFNPQIIHCHDLEPLPLCIMNSYSRMLLYDAHEIQFGISGHSKIANLVYSILERILIKASNYTITVNDEIAEILKKRYSLDTIGVILNAKRSVRNLKPEENLRSDLGLMPDAKIVIYPGGFCEGRGLFGLIDSAKHLDKNIFILLIGYGPLEDQIKEHIKESDLQSKVFVRPVVEPDYLGSILLACNLGVMPTESKAVSYQYGLGNKFFHYLSAGLPIAAADQISKKRLIQKYDIGCTFEAENPHSIASAINYLLSDEKEYNRLRNNAFLAQEDLSWEKQEKKLLDIYHSMITTENLNPAQ